MNLVLSAAACARTIVAREQPTLLSGRTNCDSGQFLHQWKGSSDSDAEDGRLCLVVSCFMFTSAEQLYIVTPLSKF